MQREQQSACVDWQERKMVKNKKDKMRGPQRRGLGGPGQKRGNGGGEAEVNPFERRNISIKHKVLGKVKSKKAERKSVSLARMEAFEARKRTLLVEDKQDNKSNTFIDRRFAEDEDIPEEDKMLMRFQRERLARLRKGSAFAMDDDEGEQEELTHGGTALGEMTKFDDFGGDISDSDEENLGRDTVRDYHFGGGFVPAGEGEERKRSKKEIMEEIIAKSKMYKAEKRKEKDERDEMLEQLNSDFADISALLAPNVRAPKAQKGQDGAPVRRKDPPDGDQGLDEFDAMTRELATEMRAHATQRLKTPEEIAQEERDALVAAEKQRRRRMQGVIFPSTPFQEESTRTPPTSRVHATWSCSCRPPRFALYHVGHASRCKC